MKVLYTPDPVRFVRMTTSEIREAFLLDGLFEPKVISLFYSDIDRTIVGSAVPEKKPLSLSTSKELAAEYFTQRREIGVLNIGNDGRIVLDGRAFDMKNKDVLYIGRGSREIAFHSLNADSPAKFYLLSYPAHKELPSSLARKADAEAVHLGSSESANQRTIYKMIHPAGIQTCQLVMGYTELASGSVWNTMPPHTHERRMEVYLYFDMDPSTRVFHLMGQPEETRHIVVADGQAVISPSWSIHSGVGTGAYTFCWGMGGENQQFDDMDGISIDRMK